MKRPAPVDVAPALADAATAIAEARWADAATALLAAWRDCRSERIARALAGLDLRLPPPAPLEGKLVKTREAHWHELVARGDEESLRRALAAPWPTHPKEARARVEALKPFTSARISNALLALHRSSQYTSINGLRLSREIFHQLIEKDDHAVVAELERFEKQAFEAYRLGRAVLRRRRPQPPYLAPAGEAALAQIEQLLAVEERAEAPTRDNLLAAIYEAPHDDAPRIVYADVLTEAGDPRGEFITLQLQGNDPKREAKLLKAAGRQWLDGLDADGATKIVHRRGFPAVATLAAGEVRAPAWATIETLHLMNDCELRGGPQLRALRELYNLGAKELPTTTLPSYELDVLGVRDFPNGLDVDTPFAPRVLGLARPNLVDRILAAVRGLRAMPIARRLETVRLAWTLFELPHAIGLAAETQFTIEQRGTYELERSQGWTARVTRDELRLHWAGDDGRDSERTFQSIVPALTTLRAPRIASLVVTGLVGLAGPPLDQLRETLGRAVGRWPQLRSAEILGLRLSGSN